MADQIERIRTVILQDKTLREFDGGFTSIPNRILENTGLSLGARMAYAMLLKYAWQKDFCFPAQERIATDLGVTDRSVRTFLNELRDNTLINWKRQGLNRPNIYYILRLPDRGPQDRGPENISGPDRKRSSRPDRKQASGLERKPASDKEDSNKNTQSVNVNGFQKSPKSWAPEAPEDADRRLRQGALVAEMLDVLRDPHSRGFYVRVAQVLPDDLIWRALSETKAEAAMGRIKKSRGAFFTNAVTRLARDHGYDLEARSPTARGLAAS